MGRVWRKWARVWMGTRMGMTVGGACVGKEGEGTTGRRERGGEGQDKGDMGRGRKLIVPGFCLRGREEKGRVQGRRLANRRGIDDVGRGGVSREGGRGGSREEGWPIASSLWWCRSGSSRQGWGRGWCALDSSGSVRVKGGL